MASLETPALARALDQLSQLVAAQALRPSAPLPPAVEDALLTHIAMGLQAIRRAQRAPHAPDQRYHLAHALQELNAAVTVLQEWTTPERA